MNPIIYDSSGNELSIEIDKLGNGEEIYHIDRGSFGIGEMCLIQYYYRYDGESEYGKTISLGGIGYAILSDKGKIIANINYDKESIIEEFIDGPYITNIEISERPLDFIDGLAIISFNYEDVWTGYNLLTIEGEIILNKNYRSLERVNDYFLGSDSENNRYIIGRNGETK